MFFGHLQIRKVTKIFECGEFSTRMLSLVKMPLQYVYQRKMKQRMSVQICERCLVFHYLQEPDAGINLQAALQKTLNQTDFSLEITVTEWVFCLYYFLYLFEGMMCTMDRSFSQLEKVVEMKIQNNTEVISKEQFLFHFSTLQIIGTWLCP